MSDPSDQSPTTPTSTVPPAPPTASAPPSPPAAPPPEPSGSRRALIGAGAALLVLAVAGIAFGASQLAAPQRSVDRGTALDQTDDGQRDRPAARRMLRDPDRRIRLLPGDRGLRAPGFVLGGGREITITAINGSDLTVTAADGWTRSVTVNADTAIRRAGQSITLTDLAVGDEIRFRQERNDDGTYTVTAIEVILPHVVGQVTATSADGFTVERPDGTTMTIHVAATTTYRVRGVENATLADIAVGMVVLAQGTQNADGTLEALAVHASARS